MIFIAFIAMATLTSQANEEVKTDASISIEAPADINETKTEEVK